MEGMESGGTEGGDIFSIYRMLIREKYALNYEMILFINRNA